MTMTISEQRYRQAIQELLDQCDELQTQRDALLDALEQVLAHLDPTARESGSGSEHATRITQHARHIVAQIRQTEREE